MREVSLDSSPLAVHNREWRARIQSDKRQIARHVPSRLRPLHDTVVERAVANGAEALILSGSTARRARTAISDFDYHLIGRPIETGDLPRELDLHVLSPGPFESKLLAGDDFVQWSLRFGWVVFDRGPARRAVELIAQRNLWPDAARKTDHAKKSLRLAHRFVASGDRDAAVDQARGALSLAARAHLLSLGVFPLSRAELPVQLRAVGQEEAAGALAASIYADPSLGELERAVRLGDALVALSGEALKTGHAT